MPVRYELITEPSLYRGRLGEVSKLFSRVFERRFPASGWEQWYFANPYGAPVVIVGYDGGELIAHNALIPQVLMKDGDHTPLMYGLSASTMVDRRYRHVSLFEEIVGRLQEFARGEGTGFVLGFPNSNSYLPYKVLFGYETLLETPVMLWTPGASRADLAIENLPAVSRAPGEYSYPDDSVYWTWRMQERTGGRALLNKTVELAYKVDGRVLTVLDLGIRGPAAEAAELLGAFARAKGAGQVRLTGYHAVLANIPSLECTPHEHYMVRMTACPLAGNLAKIRFSLLLSDVF
jgi:hypothetical protein